MLSIAWLLQLLLDGGCSQSLMDACAAMRTLIATAVLGPVVTFFSGWLIALLHQTLLVLLCGTCERLALSWI